MKFRHLFAMVVSLLFIFSFCTDTEAYLQRVSFNVWTTTYTDDQQLNVWIQIYDTESKNPPDVISTIALTAPDGTVFNLTTAQNWRPYDEGYWASYRATDFDSGVIPAGNYQVRVVAPKYNLVITQDDFCDATYLDPPVITSPTDGATVGSKPLITWSSVPGATYYRVLLWNETNNEPLYWYWEKRFFTNHTACLLSFGDLQPNRYYKLRIEARAGSQDLDKRSRSDWIYFYTSDWTSSESEDFNIKLK